MKKAIGIVLMMLGIGFIACENEAKTGDPTMVAMASNEEFTTGVKFETWRPQFTDLVVASENVFYMKAETDSTMLALRVPYTLFENQAKRSFEFGDVVTVDATNKTAAFAQYVVFDKKTKVAIAIYKTGVDIENTGVFTYAADDKQVPGTITAEFHANMHKDTLPGYHKLSEAQKDYYTNTLRNTKSFQDAVIYKMPVTAGK